MLQFTQASLAHTSSLSVMPWAVGFGHVGDRVLDLNCRRRPTASSQLQSVMQR